MIAEPSNNKTVDAEKHEAPVNFLTSNITILASIIAHPLTVPKSCRGLNVHRVTFSIFVMHWVRSYVMTPYLLSFSILRCEQPKRVL